MGMSFNHWRNTMLHLSDDEIVRLVANELSATEAEAAHTHIGSCETCAARAREQERLWVLLGEWEVAPPVSGAVDNVLARLDQEAKLPFVAGPRRTDWLRVGRLAASVLIAVGAGYGIGRWRVRQTEGPQPVDSTAAIAEVVDSFGLNVFASAPIGLADAVDGSASDAEQPGDQS